MQPRIDLSGECWLCISLCYASIVMHANIGLDWISQKKSVKVLLLLQLYELVGVLTSLFSTNRAISEMEDQRWRAIPTQKRKASDILTSALAAFLFSSQPPQSRKGSKAHLNYYNSGYNRGSYLSHRNTKLNQTLQKQAYILK